MSTALAIAAVTAVLKDLLYNGIIDHLPPGLNDVQVSALPPDRLLTNDQEPSRLNLFMYHVTPNIGWRNVGLPSFDSQGNRVTNPPLPLDLHYLLTGYGAPEFHPEILLGYGMQVLHDTPVLTPAAIRKALNPTTPVGGGGIPVGLRDLATSGVGDQIESIKVCPEGLNPDELSKLWTAFQARFRPTAAYQASVVLIEGRKTTRPTLPVRERLLYVMPLRQPVIESVVSAEGETSPIRPGTAILIRGARLRGEETRARLGESEVIVSPADAGDAEARVVLPATLRAGVVQAQVVHYTKMGRPPQSRPGLESNVGAFVLHPVILPGAGPDAWRIAVNNVQTQPGNRRSAELVVTVDPAVGPSQRVLLLLSSLPGDEPEGFFEAGERTAETSSVTVPVSGIAPGTYLVRVQLDGAESPLEMDPGGAPVGPKVSIA